jgi:hypothetical protein
MWKDFRNMAGHHPFAELRAPIAADPARAERLATAERQVAEEQAVYDQIMAALERAHAYTQAQLALAGNDVAQIERNVVLYLSTLQNYLEAMGSDLDVLARIGATPIHLTLADLLPARDRDTEPDMAAEPSVP